MPLQGSELKLSGVHTREKIHRIHGGEIKTDTESSARAITNDFIV
jgi:hypothetical protein